MNPNYNFSQQNITMQQQGQGGGTVGASNMMPPQQGNMSQMMAPRSQMSEMNFGAGGVQQQQQQGIRAFAQQRQVRPQNPQPGPGQQQMQGQNFGGVPPNQNVMFQGQQQQIANQGINLILYENKKVQMLKIYFVISRNESELQFCPTKHGNAAATGSS